MHDNSKFSFKEFFRSAKYFQGNRSPIDAEKHDFGYSYAWQNHHNKNKHHWEYWTDWKNGEVYGVKIPFKYVLEMVADFIGAGKIYNKGNWNRHMPLDYHLKTKDNRVFHEDTLKLLTSLFEIIDVYDLKIGLKTIKKDKKKMKREYEGGNKMEEFKVGDFVLYQKGNEFHLGEVKEVVELERRRRLRQDGLNGEPTGEFEKYKMYRVLYHTGDTASLTSPEHIRRIENAYAFDIIRKKA